MPTSARFGALTELKRRQEAIGQILRDAAKHPFKNRFNQKSKGRVSSASTKKAANLKQDEKPLK
jgi:hypothetical protein